MKMSEWAKREVEIACKKENEQVLNWLKALEILKEKLDFHGNEDYSITITEKGKLDNEKSPKLIIKTNKEQYFSLKEVLCNETKTE